ncbi:MAG: NAD(P)H-dependent oxidoreductase [Woeseia sp.]
MTGRRIAIIQGHPDMADTHYCHALASVYGDAAAAAGHEVRNIQVAGKPFELVRSKHDWDSGPVPAEIQSAQQTIAWADHLLIVYPLWLGTMPAMLKGFFEQVLRPGYAVDFGEDGRWRKLLTGKSARIVITMGMPALAYRWFFRAHSLKSLERNILAFVGIKPVRSTLIGLVEQSDARRNRWLKRLADLGRKGR